MRHVSSKTKAVLVIVLSRAIGCSGESQEGARGKVADSTGGTFSTVSGSSAVSTEGTGRIATGGAVSASARSIATTPLASGGVIATNNQSNANGGRTWLEASTAIVGGTANSITSTPSAGGPGATHAVSAIFAGGEVSCALSNGEAYCWGNDYSGTPSNGSYPWNAAPVPLTGVPSGVTAVAIGARHQCAVADGRVLCWGANDLGQLGDGSSQPGSPSSVPIEVPNLDPNVTAIAAGYFHTCALAQGALKCWGWVSRARHLLSASTPEPALASGVTAVFAGWWRTCNVIDSRALCWGGNVGESAVALPVKDLAPGITSIAFGESYACASSSRGVECWEEREISGNNDETWGTNLTPVLELSGSVTSVVAGSSHFCALVDGGVQCWGSNYKGALGNNSTVDSPVPVPVQGLSSGVTALAAGSRHTCALLEGEVHCWGNNANGTLGNNSTTDSPVPVRVQFP